MAPSRSIPRGQPLIYKHLTSTCLQHGLIGQSNSHDQARVSVGGVYKGRECQAVWFISVASTVYLTRICFRIDNSKSVFSVPSGPYQYVDSSLLIFLGSVLFWFFSALGGSDGNFTGQNLLLFFFCFFLEVGLYKWRLFTSMHFLSRVCGELGASSSDGVVKRISSMGRFWERVKGRV